MNSEELFTGERFVPGIDDDEITIEHYQRYQTILDLVKGKVVLDAACGEGYGTSIIGSVAQKVTGLDIDAGAVSRATEAYGNEKVSYMQGSIAEINLPDHSIDVLVSFETIEHVNAELQEQFVREAARVLKEDGLFIISSPNKAIYSDLFDYHNEYHVHELYKDEFVGKLKEEFPNVKLFNQYWEVTSIIDGDDKVGQLKYHRDVDKYTSDGKYFIALASKQDVTEFSIGSVYVKEDVTYRKNMLRIIQLQDEVDERNKHLAKLDAEIEMKDERILQLEKLAEQQGTQIEQQGAQIEQQGAQIESKEAEILILNKQVKDHAKIVYDKDVHIHNIENQIDYINLRYHKWMRLADSKPVRAVLFPKRVIRKAKNMLRDIKGVQKIRIPQFSEPKVSIVIPVYNQFDYTYQCVKSIVDTVKDVSYEIIIGDDMSTDKTKLIKKIMPGIRVNINETDHGFLMNCNRAANLAKGEYVMFLNNDTQVKEEWLSSLVELIEGDETIGMVGSKLVYPDGKLQEAGGIIWNDGSGWNYGRNQDPEAPEYNYVREVDYISGASIMIRRNLWDAIGGFDERYKPAYCEDSDLAFEVRKLGYKVKYQPKSVVVHFEGISNGTDLNSGLKKYQVENSRKFREKWKDVLAKHYNNSQNLFCARERNYGKKVVLFVDHYVPTFDKDAGSRTVFQYIKMFLKRGYIVKFIGDNYAKIEPYVSILEGMGVEVLYGSWYMTNIWDYLRENKNYIDYVFLNRPHISRKYIDFMKEEMTAKIMFYGSDLHYLRVAREAELNNDEEKREESIYWKIIEQDLLKKVDVAYYLSPVEKEEIHAFDPSIVVRNIKINVFETFRERINLDFETKEGLLFVGGFAHTPNIDAVVWFIEKVYPIVRKEKEIPFYVVGANPPDELVQIAKDGVILKGFVSDEELSKLYDECRLAIVPLRFGAGIKGKVIEALYYGIPLITTSIGAEGITDIENYALIEDDAEKLARLILDTYDDYAKLERMCAQSQNYVKEQFSEEAAWDVIKNDFS